MIYSIMLPIPLTYAEYKDALKNNWIGTHLQVSMNEVVQKIFPDQDFSPKYKNEALITPEEFEVFYMIRTGNFEEIKVRFKNGSIYFVEGTESFDEKTKIQDLIREGQYQNIEIKQENRKVVSIKRTVKKMIN